MIRDIITNKWFIGAIALLIIIAGACYLWYQHDTAPYRQEAVESAKLLRQREATQKAENNEVEQAAEKASAESNTPTAEKSVTEAPDRGAEGPEVAVQSQSTEKPSENAETAEVPISPHGFGPFPKVPADYPYGITWRDMEYYERLPSYKERRFELMERVLVKLWSEGIRNFEGASIENDKVYPHFFNTYYIIVEEREAPDGTLEPFITRIKGGSPSPADIDLLNPPPHIQVLDFETTGIDPYQYLNLH